MSDRLPSLKADGHVIPRLMDVWPKLVVVEGIMGSGKSLTTLNIAHRLEASAIPASA